MSTWRFDLMELDGTPIGTVQNATDRSLSLALNSNPTASFTIRLDNERAEEITTREADVMLKIYMDDTLVFLGDCISAEEVGGEDGKHTLACNFAGPLWRLQKRIVPDSLTAYGYQRLWAADDIIGEAITSTNALGDTGIRIGTLASLYEAGIGVDPLHVKPTAEVLTDLQNAKVPQSVITPLDFEIHDTLEGGATPVHGRTDAEGNTWNSQGSGADYTIVGAPGFAYRTSATVDNRWVISSNSGATVGPLIAGMDFAHDHRSQHDYLVYFGFYVRLSGHTPATLPSGNWLRVILAWDTTPGSIVLEKNTGGTGGTPVNLGTYVIDSVGPYYFAANVWYSIRLVVDEFGNYWLYQYETPLTPGTGWIGSPKISGQHDDLAVGGTLGTGTCAFGDYFDGGGFAGTRLFRNVFASQYTGPQSFDFEFVPSEPTADTNQSGVVGAGLKLWTFNLYEPAMGTTTTAVFEFGPSMKSYSRKIDRDGLMTVGYAPPPDASGTDIRTARNDAAIAARGLYEEVIPSDVSDSELRQALVNLNVQVRKQARQLITFEPTSRAPVFGPSGDYVVGDYVIGRAVINGTERFSGTFRAYGVDIQIDDNGKDTVTPTLVPA